MNLKRFFAGLFTVIGLGSLVCAAVLYVGKLTGPNDIKALFTFGILGFIFFIAGISLTHTIENKT